MVHPNQRSQAWRDIAGDIVACFVEAVNDFDADRLVDLFAQDAHVNDQLRDFWGKAAIADWIRREIVGARFCMQVLEARKHFGEIILSASVSGDFDKTGLPAPLILNFIFSFCDGKVARLLVLVTREGEAEPDIRKVGS